ncbi:MAG: hypothetical protein A2Y64_08445 [Candidatus Coatesbacteria bacterium RBG_13_66_14]|uniref:Uncharacterized protein n=1 Tax=Candidatus Coatesbacteria bacterium RBG_13_66_14 TaxID=1817816 RepID=A0A1F5FHR1_9BACT|nr:MAG: hypothetical protein A2Y64_08445 [Candidatus Coatesbacteria bacterium RBG_13_66_14]
MLAPVLAAGCLDFSSIEAPTRIAPGERFPVTLHVMADSDQTACGFLGVLTPSAWSVAAEGYGGYAAGRLDPSRSSTAWLEFNDPAQEGCRWTGFVTDRALTGRGAYHADLYLVPDDRNGDRRLVFVVGACEGPAGAVWKELDRREVRVTVVGDAGTVRLSWGQLKALNG